MILNEGFEISALEMFHFSKATIEEFYDVYKQVLPEYVPLIEQFISGPSIVLEVRQANVVKTFREMVGPSDPEIAKYLRPDTIRAKFGFDRVRNAVHCTDLPEDGVIEVRTPPSLKLSLVRVLLQDPAKLPVRQGYFLFTFRSLITANL